MYLFVVVLRRACVSFKVIILYSLYAFMILYANTKFHSIRYMHVVLHNLTIIILITSSPLSLTSLKLNKYSLWYVSDIVVSRFFLKVKMFDLSLSKYINSFTFHIDNWTHCCKIYIFVVNEERNLHTRQTN